MTRLHYIANMRLPTEKAHGLQIMQNCEAFADAGADVTLWVARRVNTQEMKAIPDPWQHYGVKPNFRLRRVPCIDLMMLVPDRYDLLAKLIFHLQQWTFTLAALIMALFARADVIYSRDLPVLLLLSWVKPHPMLVYEAHQRRPSRAGRWLQQQVVRRVGTVIAVTARLGQDLEKLLSPPLRPSPLHGEGSGKFLVAHDGIRRERFVNPPSQAEARAALGWPAEAFIVGYVGRLQTMAMDKGVSALVDALRQVDGVTLALVGGPDDIAHSLRRRWLSLGLDERCFINAGQISPERVPLYLAAFDVCAMPFPWMEHFAYYASPIKLFEYMAARRAIVASNLPSTAEVVRDGESALLYPPGDVAALAAAITRLRGDPALRERLAARAFADVMAHYTWEARAKAILKHVMSHEG